MEKEIFKVFTNQICKNCIYAKECREDKIILLEENKNITVKCNDYIREAKNMKDYQKQINKLLYALKQKGKIYKVTTNKFFSEKSNNYITKTSLYKLTEKIIDKDGEIKNKYEKVLDTFSKIELLKYLVQENKKEVENNE